MALQLPPLGEQRKIAAILASVDEAIAKTRAVIDQVRVIKKGLMQELLTRGLPGRHTRFKQTEIGEVPEDWQVAPLAQFIEGIDAGWSPKCAANPATTNQWGVLKVSAISSGTYREYENKQLPTALEPRPELEVQAGDVLVARASGVLELVGIPAFVWATRPKLMLSDKTLRIRPRSTQLENYCLYLVLCLPRVRDFVLQGTAGSHMRNISQNVLRATPVPVASLEEQRSICGVLKAIELRLHTEREKHSALQTLKTALLSVLLTGEVRVHVEENAA